LFLLAKNYSPSINTIGWYVSTKLDGVRAIWNGKQLLSRNGNVFAAPDYFIKSLPKDVMIDGELFIGPKQFSETVSIVKSFNDKGWSKIRFVAFDLPSSKERVEGRWNQLKKLVEQVGKPLEYMPQYELKDPNLLYVLLDKVLEQGNEGLMLRKPRSFYEGKRSDTLLKLKKFFDAEAKVINHIPLESSTKTNMMGALECVDEKGLVFKVGTGFNDEQRLNPPPIGSIITYKFQEKTPDNKPRFPVFVRVRKDI